jgi:hypothetical protein
MSFRLKVLIGVVLAAFAASHVAAAYKLDAGTSRQTSDLISLQRD